MADESTFFNSRKRVQRVEIYIIRRTGEAVYGDVSCIEGSEVLEEVGALAGVDPEIGQGTFHQRLGLGNVAPDYGNAQSRDAGAPAAVGCNSAILIDKLLRWD